MKTQTTDLSSNLTTVRRNVKSAVKPKSEPQPKADIDDFADFPVTEKPAKSKNCLMKFLYFMFEIETPQDCLILLFSCLVGVGLIWLACIKETPHKPTLEEWPEMQEQIYGKEEKKRDDYHD